MTKSNSETEKILTPCGFLYVTALYDNHNKITKYLYRADKNSNCSSAMIDGVFTAINRALEIGVESDYFITGLSGISCKRNSLSENKYLSCMDALSAAMHSLKII